ncbi:MAG TPA: tetratricopeptide repeat protein [Candidatus Binataceae bacterium]|nr:tetratricopeptide repeat protein [Candidatus Binataceae bacterium]
MPDQENISISAPTDSAQDSSASTSFDGKLGPRAGLAAILAITALIYSRALGFELVTDDGFWLRNPYIKDWSFAWYSIIHDSWWFHNPKNLPQSPYYRPMQGTLATTLFHLFGPSSAAWHAVMIVFYLIVIWMVFRVATLLCSIEWTGLFAAALFALMPMHAQSVVWCTVTDMPMNVAFQLAAFEFYLHRASVPASDGRRKRWLWLSLGFFWCALMSYDSAVTFPALVALHAYLLGSDRTSSSEDSHAVKAALGDHIRRVFSAIWPYLVVTAGYFGLRLWMLGFISRTFEGNGMTVLEMALTLPLALVNYAAILLIPWLAMPAHHLPTIRTVTAPEFYVPLASLSALFALSFYLFTHHPHGRLYCFCVAWILIALGPALDIRALQAGIEIADRYLYFPSFGFCVMAADLAVWFALASERRMRAIAAGAAGVMLLYAALLYHQENYWRDNVAFFSGCIEGAPRVALWHNQLAQALEERGNLAGARKEFAAAAALEPDDPSNLHFLGLIDERLGDRPAAVRELTAALKLRSNPPPDAFAELAIIMDAAGDPTSAELELKRAEQIPRGANIAALARAQLQFRHGDMKGAEQALVRLLQRTPNNAAALSILGTVFLSERRYPEALDAYRRAEKIEPYDPALHYRVAVVLHVLGRNRAARDECVLALAGAPHDSHIRALMAEIEASTRTK